MSASINFLESQLIAAVTEYNTTESLESFWTILLNANNFNIAKYRQRIQQTESGIVILWRGLLGAELELLTDSQVLDIFNSGKTISEINTILAGMGIDVDKEAALDAIFNPVP